MYAKNLLGITLLACLIAVSFGGKKVKQVRCPVFPENCSLCKVHHNVPGLTFPIPTYSSKVLYPTEHRTTYICEDKSVRKNKFYVLLLTYSAKDVRGYNVVGFTKRLKYYDKKTYQEIFIPQYYS